MVAEFPELLIVGAMLTLLNTRVVGAQCQFDPSWLGRTWWTGYEAGEQSMLGQSPYFYDTFSDQSVTSYKHPEDSTVIEKWDCDQQATNVIAGFSHHFYVMKNAETDNYECREYVPLPPSFILWKRHTFGAIRPTIETCQSDLARVRTIDVMVVYVNHLLAMAPCPWSEGEYSLSVHYQTAQLEKRRCPATGQRSTIEGSRLVTKACDMTDSYEHPFNSQLYCVATWSGSALWTPDGIHDDYVALSRYDMKTSKYLLYISRYMKEPSGLIKISLKMSPERRVTFDPYNPISHVDRRHSVFLFSPILHSLPEISINLPLVSTTRHPFNQPQTSKPPNVQQTTSMFLPAVTTRPATRVGSTRMMSSRFTMRPTTTSKEQPTTGEGIPGMIDDKPCPATPCVNNGRCLLPDGICLCPMETVGSHCEKVLGPNEIPRADITQTPSTDGAREDQVKPDDKIAGNNENSMTRTVQADAKTTMPPTRSRTNDKSEEKEKVEVLEDETEQNNIFISLITLSVPFTVLSIILCPIVCCRKPKTFNFDDKKDLVANEMPFDLEEGAVPPYTATYNGQNVQAWFPDYKASRAGPALRATSNDV